VSDGVRPITFAEAAGLGIIAALVSGRRIASVSYTNLDDVGSPAGNPHGIVDEVDMAVAIGLDDRHELLIEWAMLGPTEGIDVQLLEARAVSRSDVDVSAVSNWRPMIGARISHVGVSWHQSESVEALWALRVSTELGAASIALGALEGGIPRYRPDALVVIFDEAIAQAYWPPDAGASAFGGAVDDGRGRASRGS
jgi:hypothetical protein